MEIRCKCRCREEQGQEQGRAMRKARKKAGTALLFRLFESGRGERIRTSGLYVPNVALYQAKLHPVSNCDCKCYLVGVRGFEPPASTSRT